MKHLQETNKIIEHVLKTKQLGINIHPVILKDVNVVIAQDASLHNAEQFHSQGAMVIGIADGDFAAGREGGFNMVAWKSGKIQRVVNSSLDAESKSMAASMRCGEWVSRLLAEMTNMYFQLSLNYDQAASWDSSTTERPHAPLRLSGVLVVKDSAEEILKKVLVVTDAKSLYDLLQRDLSRGKDHGVAATCAEIKQVLAAIKGQVRWMPHNEMIVDPLTKILGKSNMTPLLKVMSTGSWKIGSEVSEMQYRKDVRDQGLNVQRKKGVSFDANFYVDLGDQNDVLWKAPFYRSGESKAPGPPGGEKESRGRSRERRDRSRERRDKTRKESGSVKEEISEKGTRSPKGERKDATGSKGTKKDSPKASRERRRRIESPKRSKDKKAELLVLLLKQRL